MIPRSPPQPYAFGRASAGKTERLGKLRAVDVGVASLHTTPAALAAPRSAPSCEPHSNYTVSRRLQAGCGPERCRR